MPRTVSAGLGAAWRSGLASGATGYLIQETTLTASWAKSLFIFISVLGEAHWGEKKKGKQLGSSNGAEPPMPLVPLELLDVTGCTKLSLGWETLMNCADRGWNFPASRDVLRSLRLST